MDNLFIDLDLGADINAPRWFIQEVQKGIDGRDPGKNDLLLIAPGEVSNPGGRPSTNHLEPIDPFFAEFSLTVVTNKAAGRQAIQDRKRDIGLDRSVQQESFEFPVLGYHDDSVGDGVTGRFWYEWFALPDDLPFGMAQCAEENFQQFGPTAANDAGDPEDLTTMQVETNPGQLPGNIDVPNGKSDVPQRKRHIGIKLINRPIDHALDHVLI